MYISIIISMHIHTYSCVYYVHTYSCVCMCTHTCIYAWIATHTQSQTLCACVLFINLIVVQAWSSIKYPPHGNPHTQFYASNTRKRKHLTLGK